ncbi:transcriptional antiterminator [Orenia metallireducens]|uniref:Transcriptional antiterminator n=1 Tax=Orenia metallireducens TaxID=1413210 RepID=A0A285H3A8_9FIRM|nr:HTH domain-containing protein [Orenia metallireducens]PRX29492.1 transcriptional antiterminator [Orenia metallireducens]SNY30215.1 Transcriptional antiterminator [Orenia metallireducens]
MLNLSKCRYNKIIDSLLRAERIVTIKELANRCNVSSRTIRSDLKELELELDKFSISLYKRPGVGVWLEAADNDRKLLESELSRKEIEYVVLSPRERINDIIKRLLLNHKDYTIMALAEELSVSRSTIIKDLLEVEQWLNKYQLMLRRIKNYGIYIEGREIHLREAMVNIIFELLDNQLEEISQLLMNNKSIYPQNYDVLREFCSNIDLKKIKRIIETNKIKNNYLYSRRSILYITFYGSVTLKRIKEGKEIKLTSHELKELNKLKLYKIFKSFKGILEKIMGLKISQDEFGGGFLQCLAQEFYLEKKVGDGQEVLNRIDEEVIDIMNRFIAIAERRLGINIKDDTTAYINLMLYINHILKKAKYGVSRSILSDIDNGIIEDVKEFHPNIFKIAAEIKEIFRRYSIAIKQYDIYHIALLLLSIFEKSKDKIKALVIFHENRVINDLIKTRLINKMANFKIVKTLYYYQLDEEISEKVDVIISYKRLSQVPEAIVISPLVDDNDIEIINNKVKLAKDNWKIGN